MFSVDWEGASRQANELQWTGNSQLTVNPLTRPCFITNCICIWSRLHSQGCSTRIRNPNQNRIWKSHVPAHWALDIYFQPRCNFQMPSLALGYLDKQHLHQRTEAAGYFNCFYVLFYKGLFGCWPKLLLYYNLVATWSPFRLGLDQTGRLYLGSRRLQLRWLGEFIGVGTCVAQPPHTPLPISLWYHVNAVGLKYIDNCSFTFSARPIPRMEWERDWMSKAGTCTWLTFWPFESFSIGAIVEVVKLWIKNGRNIT